MDDIPPERRRVRGPWRDGLRLRATLALWGAVPYGLAATLCLFVVPTCPWARSEQPSSRRAHTSQSEAQAHGSSWQDMRAVLAQASTLRRNGDSQGALRAYRRVAGATVARDVDRERATYWEARLRIEEGEQSALFELENWVDETRDPMLLARVAQLARRQAAHATSASWETLSVGLYSASIDALTIRSAARDENGERAKRWLDVLAK